VIRRAFAAVLILLLALGVPPVWACSTCFGDPNSQMVKGAVMGVYVMVGVVGSVLFGFTCTGLFWIRRSRRLARISPSIEQGEAS